MASSENPRAPRAAEAPVLVPDAGGALTGSLSGQAAELLQAVVADGGAIGWVTPPPADEITGLFRSVSDHAARGDAHVAAVVVADRLVGIGYWQRFERATNRQNADLQKIAVSPAYRGRGVARQLCEHLIDVAREAGIEILTLDVRVDNTIAIRLYESLGFVRYGTLPQFIAMNGNRYDKAFYYLRLSPGP
jgi:ribosomal protein S18 acetylase RimI-like enzyme